MQDTIPTVALDGLEPQIQSIGADLLDRMAAHPAPGLLSKQGAYARLMEWSMRDPAFKAQLFRFVDVLPTLDSSAEIVRHLQEYLGDQARYFPAIGNNPTNIEILKSIL